MNFTIQKFLSPSICEYATLEEDSSPKKKRPEPKPIIGVKRSLLAFQKAQDLEKWPRKLEDMINFPKPAKPALHLPYLEDPGFTSNQPQEWQPGDLLSHSEALHNILGSTMPHWIRIPDESHILTEPEHELNQNPHHKWKPKTEQKIVQVPKPEVNFTLDHHDIINSMTRLMHLSCPRKSEIITGSQGISQEEHKNRAELSQKDGHTNQGKQLQERRPSNQICPKKNIILHHADAPKNVEKISGCKEESFKEIPQDNLLLRGGSTPKMVRTEPTRSMKDHPLKKRDNAKVHSRGVIISYLLKEEPPDAQSIPKPKQYQGYQVSRSKLCQGGGYDAAIRSATEPEVNPKPYSTSRGANQDIRALNMPYLTNQEGCKEESFKEIPPDNLLLLGGSTPKMVRTEPSRSMKDHPLKKRGIAKVHSRGVIISYLLKEEPPDAQSIPKPKQYQGYQVSRSKLFRGGGYDAVIRSATEPEVNPKPYLTSQGVQNNCNWAKILIEKEVMNFRSQRFLSPSICEYATLEEDSSPNKKRPEPKPIIGVKRSLLPFQKAQDLEKWPRKLEDMINFPKPAKPALHLPYLEDPGFTSNQPQ
ncbi:hypothetical protein DY000_02050309 [Brassica cretica]|uniref:TPX2 central domain-containing protein n=1 Tax=Brassica cretica TaxID=69181 RepID=A0ABQ7EZK3_BRACR|nr:hypothetical protein DY000_02050309 [Brassica cretica]